MTINSISIGNRALEFIELRIQDKKYRGSHYSQHNRYTMVKIIEILRLLNKYAPSQQLMIIRNTDLKKRPNNTADEYDYARFCDEAKNKAGIGTQDAMRKNIFVDLHRMGLINRYDNNKCLLDPFARSSVKFVSLSTDGLKLIGATNILNQYFIFSKALDKLLGGAVNLILNILRDSDYNLNKISMYEFMLFITAIDTASEFQLSINEAVDLIKSYRSLGRIQQHAVIDALKKQLNPKSYRGAKPNKRDFHNWINETQQIFGLLNQTVYFEVSNNDLMLKIGKEGFEENDNKLGRSTSEKELYFLQHKVNKTSGFELHHVVPLAWSENREHFKILDKWENMVYIDAFSHAKITQNNNKNIVMKFENDDMLLSDYSEHCVHLKNVKNILYEPSNKTILGNYNYELINTVR